MERKKCTSCSVVIMLYCTVFAGVSSTFCIGTSRRCPDEGEAPLEERVTFSEDRIDRGFMFYDGRYVAAPYVVERQGLDILINGKDINTETTRHGDSEKDLIVQRLDLVVRQYERRLEEGYCFFFFSQGGEIRLSPYAAAYTLPSVARKLRCDIPEEEKLREVRRRNWHLGVEPSALRTLVTSFHAPPEFDKRVKRMGQVLLRVQEFGTTEGQPINEGFVFSDGRYLEAPYIVSRQGLAIFVNNELIIRPAPWPGPKPPSGKVNPDLPQAVSRETSLYDDILKEYLADKFAFTSLHCDRQEQREILEKTIHNLPCVKVAKLDEKHPTVLHVTSFRGEECAFLLVSIRRKDEPYDEEDFLRRAERARTTLERRLSEGHCVFSFSIGTRTSMGPSWVADKLPGIVAILHSTEPQEVKIHKLRQQGLKRMSRESIVRLVGGFVPSRQLDRRLGQLTRAPADKPAEPD